MTAARAPGVLIVEDERIVAMDLQQTLAGMGYDAFAIASSAEEAIERAGERRPDVVLMDIRIEGRRDGIETAQILREQFHTPVVYLTAHSDEAIIERAKITEPYGYLLKPVQDSELRSVVAIAVYKGQSEAARARVAELESSQGILLEINRLKDRFLANLSHELRTPLNAVIGFAELMRTGAAGPMQNRAQEEFLDYVLTGGRRFLEIINDVLDLARIEAGAAEVHAAAVDLPLLIGGLVEALRPAIDAKGHRIDIAIDPACGGLCTDPALLRQLLFKYLSNAVKFTPPGNGRLAIRAVPAEPDAIRFEVADNGIGVRPEDMDRLFLAFEQLDSSTRKRFEGAGLGLALAKRIGELLGGRVGADSAPGRGSTFFAVLPLAFVQPAASNAPIIDAA